MGTPRRVGGALQTTTPHQEAVVSVPEPSVTTAEPRPLSRERFVARLLELGRRYGDIPIYGSPEWEALDDLDPRRFASVVRAAECWRRDGDEELHVRLDEELHVADLLARWRVRMAGLDIRGDADWSRIYDVVQARREVAA